MRDDDDILHWAILESMLGVSTARWTPRDLTTTADICLWRGEGATARVLHGSLSIDPVGTVQQEQLYVRPIGLQRTFRNGWVLAINDQAVTTVGEFAAVVEKLNDPAIRKRLGLPSLEEGE